MPVETIDRARTDFDREASRICADIDAFFQQNSHNNIMPLLGCYVEGGSAFSVF